MNHRKHGLLMLLGCGLMIVAVFFLLTRGAAASDGTAGGSWAWLLFLLCPLMHLFMMGGHNHGECQHGEQKDPGKSEDAG
ncbi:DUF2933 domain-containing protein [Neomoorella humiferrea]|uniref:DUF2933 domain-containing protein n=1 Tax=Neomoorella humiferrea TaxID=676965 RepID=A0A2T0ALN7_9FIRM|nr:MULTISPECIES: DUF2933 domain-containing protein [Moorella]OIQ10421.1 hypothetical protein MOOTH_26820 [Moorella thermoacetica]PRR69516.1 hypothetical protein MOHU_23200 [Moorella humiferrea]